MIIPSDDLNITQDEHVFRAWQKVNEISIACLVLGTIYIAMGIFEGQLLIVEGLLTGALGYLLSRDTSRAAALLILWISLITFSNSMMSWLGVIDFGERNVMLACIGLWCGYRSLKATITIKGNPTSSDILRRMALVAPRK
ncbi:MAG: hypothetical protein AAGD96_05775 [Chloroflexota bacterium]